MLLLVARGPVRHGLMASHTGRSGGRRGHLWWVAVRGGRQGRARGLRVFLRLLLRELLGSSQELHHYTAGGAITSSSCALYAPIARWSSQSSSSPSWPAMADKLFSLLGVIVPDLGALPWKAAVMMSLMHNGDRP